MKIDNLNPTEQDSRKKFLQEYRDKELDYVIFDRMHHNLIDKLIEALETIDELEKDLAEERGLE